MTTLQAARSFGNAGLRPCIFGSRHRMARVPGRRARHCLAITLLPKEMTLGRNARHCLIRRS